MYKVLLISFEGFIHLLMYTIHTIIFKYNYINTEIGTLINY